jgi:hypothetical protein
MGHPDETTLFHRAITISYRSFQRDRDRPMKQSYWGGGPCYTYCVILETEHSPELYTVMPTGRSDKVAEETADTQPRGA